MPARRNRYNESAYIHDFDVRIPYKGWPKISQGQQSYPVYRSVCTDALIAYPHGLAGKKRPVKLPGDSTAKRKRKHVAVGPGVVDPKGRILYRSPCTGALFSFRKSGAKIYWDDSVLPRVPVVARLIRAPVSMTANPLPNRIQSINRRRFVAPIVTMNPRVRLTAR